MPKRKNNSLKALILAGGRGSRLGRKTIKKNKCMLKFKGKRLIERSLDNAVKMQVSEIIIVVGHVAESIINHYGNEYENTKIKYVIQKEQLGLVHAIESAKIHLKNSDFLLFLGDEFLYKPDHAPMIEHLKNKKTFCVCGMIAVKNKKHISKTYSIFFDQETRQIFRLVEKPNNPTNNLMGTGNIIFRKGILNYLNKTPINPKRNERELPDLIQCAIDDGKRVLYHPITSTYVNVNTPSDILTLKNLKK
ncbi:MAG: nucleotidyltransferase family protein [Patescibacteria group bacterium]